MIRYVNAVLLSEDLSLMVFLKKETGPANLIGKYNYLGGKIFEGESEITAISREVKEEGGIDVKEESFSLLNKIGDNTFELYNFYALVDKDILSKAYSADKEKVYVKETEEVLSHFGAPNENEYNYDFFMLLHQAIYEVEMKRKYLKEFVSLH